MDPEMDVEQQARTPLASHGFTSSYGAMPLKQGSQKDPKKLSALKAMGLSAEKDSRAGSSHSWLYSTLRCHSHYWHSFYYRVLIRTIVIVSILNFILADTDYFQKYCKSYFYVFEAVVSSILLFEYFCKVLTVPERKSSKLQNHSPDIARLQWMLSCESVIDVVSWSPFFIEVSLGMSIVNINTLIVLGILRVVRLWKLPEAWSSFRLVARVTYYNHTILGHAFLVCFLMTLSCSIMLYYLRPVHDPLDDFHSVLACMYLAVLMLTGQGEPYGIMPWYTRIIISITAIFAIAQFAIPASMLTWGFEQEAERNIAKKYEKEQKIAKLQLQGKDCPLSSSSSDASDRESEWDGYVEQVAGEDSDSSDSKDKDTDAQKQAEQGKQVLLMARATAKNLTKIEMTRAKKIFIKLDTDGDGFLEWHHIRAIADSDQNAKDLFEQLTSFKSVVGDEKVTMREFFSWLCSVKTGYKSKEKDHGAKVLQRLLDQMEANLAKKYAPAKARWKKIGDLSKGTSLLAKAAAAKGAPAPAATVAEPSVSKSKQLMQLAQKMGNLEEVNATLREKASMLEQQVAQLKTSRT